MRQLEAFEAQLLPAAAAAGQGETRDQAWAYLRALLPTLTLTLTLTPALTPNRTLPLTPNPNPYQAWAYLRELLRGALRVALLGAPRAAALPGALEAHPALKP